MNNRLISILLLIVVSAAVSATPKVTNYNLKVEFIPKNSYMNGVAETVFENDRISDSISFYLHAELSVDSILADGHKIDFHQSKEFFNYSYSLLATKVSLFLETTTDIKIYYQGYFNKSKARSPSDYMHIDESGVFLRSFGYSLWFPIFFTDWTDVNKTDFTQVEIITPEDFHPVFAGNLYQDSTYNGKRHSFWRAENISVFDAQCTAYRYILHNDKSVTVYSWSDSLSLNNSTAILQFTDKLITEYQKRFKSNVNIEQTHIMEMPEYGNISSGNVTGVDFELWRDFDNASYTKRTLAHELVHQFVQPHTSPTDSLVSMFVEGFPSYYHLPVLAELLGDDYYDEFFERVEKKYLERKSTGKDSRGRSLPLEKPLDQISFDEIGIYKDYFVLGDRGLLFMNYLRTKMGYEKFDRFSKELTNMSSISFISFRDLVLTYLPDFSDDLYIWLSTNDYPERFRIGN